MKKTKLFVKRLLVKLAWLATFALVLYGVYLYGTQDKAIVYVQEEKTNVGSMFEKYPDMQHQVELEFERRELQKQIADAQAIIDSATMRTIEIEKELGF